MLKVQIQKSKIKAQAVRLYDAFAVVWKNDDTIKQTTRKEFER